MKRRNFGKAALGIGASIGIGGVATADEFRGLSDFAEPLSRRTWNIVKYIQQKTEWRASEKYCERTVVFSVDFDDSLHVHGGIEVWGIASVLRKLAYNHHLATCEYIGDPLLFSRDVEYKCPGSRFDYGPWRVEPYSEAELRSIYDKTATEAARELGFSTDDYTQNSQLMALLGVKRS